MIMANNLSTIEICKLAIDSIDKRYSESGKLLKATFLLGPSKAVINKGSITVENKSQGNTNSENNSDQNSNNPNESFIRYNYSVLEAATKLCFNSSFKNEADNTPNSNQTQNREQEQKKPAILTVTCTIPEEGHTVWTLYVNKKATANLDKIINALRSGKFDAAYNIAKSAMKKTVVDAGAAPEATSGVDFTGSAYTSSGSPYDGIIPLSAETHITHKETVAPFIGKCNWAFDAGKSDDNADGVNLNLAVAPIDAKTGKPKESTIFKTVYNILGNVDNPVSMFIDSIIGANKQGDSNSSEKSTDPTKTLSDFIHGKFYCDGDFKQSNSYVNFLKIKKFIVTLLQKELIEFVKTESMTDDKYPARLKSANSFVYF
jgi:hypothetical protein